MNFNTFRSVSRYCLREAVGRGGITAPGAGFRSLCLVVILMSALSPLNAQTVSGQKPTAAQMPMAAYKLIAIKVTGTKRYSQDQVIAASGLQIGSSAGDDDFRRATERLGASGVFTDVAYSFAYSPAGTKLTLQVTDSTRFLPVRFEDFVWFSDDELQHKLHERAPLYTGELPFTGGLADQVSDVLQAMLVENNVAGHVEYLRFSKPGGEVDSIRYSVSSVAILIRNIEFTGAGANELPLLETAGRKLADREYASSVMSMFAEHQLLPVYRARGYLKAAFGPPQPKVAKQSTPQASDDNRNLTLIDVVFAVEPGRQYKLTGIEWSGNHAIPTETLRTLIHAKTGQPANAVKLQAELGEVEKLYGTLGYIDAKVIAEPKLDDGGETVAYRLDVHEENLYRMGELDIRGLENHFTASLRELWKIKAGAPYDASYLAEFLPQAIKLLTPNLDWEVTTHATPNSHDKTVDVELRYSVKVPQ
jgi:outer membrane protein assembly factor BamA